MITQEPFHFNDRLWNKFVEFFRYKKGYSDWTENEIWYSMCQGDIDEFMEYYREEFDLEEAKQELNDLLEQECDMRDYGKHPTRKEVNAIKKQIAEAKADIADYIMCFA